VRASVTWQIVMEDVEIPEENPLPNVSGLKGPLRLPPTTPASASPGGARRGRVLLACGREYTLNRKQFGCPLAQSADPEEACRYADRDHARPAVLPAPRPSRMRIAQHREYDLPKEAQ
jgi:hypothetical protein